jgi:hypothetical protein
MLKYVIRSFFVLVIVGALFIVCYGAAGIYVGYYHPSWLGTCKFLGTILWFGVMYLCFAIWRYDEKETGYTLSAYVFTNYLFAALPPRKEFGRVAELSLTFFLSLVAFFFFIVQSPDTGFIAREYSLAERSVFAARLTMDDVFETSAAFVSLREGVLRHDLTHNYYPDEESPAYVVVPLMRSEAVIEREVRVWLVCRSSLCGYGKPLQFRVLGRISAPETKLEKNAILHAMRNFNLDTHAEAMVVDVFSHGEDPAEALENLKTRMRDEVLDKLVSWFTAIGILGSILGLIGYAAAKTP